MPLTVLVIEDHLALRQALVAVLSGSDDLAVIGEAATAREGISAAGQHPDVIILDYRLPDMTGEEAIGALQAAAPDARVLLWTASPTEWLRALPIAGVLAKQDGLLPLLAAVRAIGPHPPVSGPAAGGGDAPTRVVVDAGDAHAWAGHVRVLRAEIAQAKEAGRLTPAVGAPDDIGTTLVKILQMIDELPVGGQAQLDLSCVGSLPAWASYHRAAWAWADALRAEGHLHSAPDAAAERFQQRLLAALLAPREPPMGAERSTGAPAVRDSRGEACEQGGARCR